MVAFRVWQYLLFGTGNVTTDWGVWASVFWRSLEPEWRRLEPEWSTDPDSELL